MKRLPKRGPKKLHPADEVAAKNVDEVLEHQKSLFHSTYMRNKISIANWNENKITVIKKHGKMFEFFGTQTKLEITLNPEEALYLIEANELELRWNTVPVSVQQAYALLLQNKSIHDTLDSYRMFQQLSRGGYVVLRHKKLAPKICVQNFIVPIQTKFTRKEPLKTWTHASSKTTFYNRSTNKSSSNLSTSSADCRKWHCNMESFIPSDFVGEMTENPNESSQCTQAGKLEKFPCFKHQYHEDFEIVCTKLNIEPVPKNRVCLCETDNEDTDTRLALARLYFYNDNDPQQLDDVNWEDLNISFDVYDRSASKKLTKKTLTYPADFSVCSVKSSDTLPISSQLSKAKYEVNKLLFCLQSSKGETFFELENVSIENL